MIWIALLRGINVGGNNILPMADLRDLLAGLGYTDPKTYIQSGNCVFGASGDATSISNAISGAIDKQFGFAPSVLMLSADELSAALDANPYKDADNALKTVHLFFISEPGAVIDTDRMNDLKADSEHFTASSGVLYLHAPDGVGRSKLVAKIDSCINAPITARNLNSATKILALAKTQ
ncbi:DUF1697 domain-containing protein [Kordiimonas aquimaris]|uniref:DUF1697 domain-containing protein n=1 Tax=Kordiimonas aquimaris TaxID=707591 RepID=UPI0021D2768E|nr:DUF1697 domain-containing protein [Kordiimonas aquimaris]